VCRQADANRHNPDWGIAGFLQRERDYSSLKNGIQVRRADGGLLGSAGRLGPADGRSAMAFLECISEELRFLVDSYGFREAIISPNRVRYASPEVTLEAVYSDRAEIDLIVDENPPTRRFQYVLYFKLYYPSVAKGLGYGIATHDEEICREVKVLAATLRLYGEPILRHDVGVFSRIKSYIVGRRGES
jgi:hypothetical protein